MGCGEWKAYHVRANLLAGDLVVDDHFFFVVFGDGAWAVSWIWVSLAIQCGLWTFGQGARAELLGGDFAEE